MNRFLCCLLLLLAQPFLPGQPAAAQVMLYENSLPPGFAYVRFASTLPAAVELHPSFGDTLKLGADGATRVSPYQVVENVATRTLLAGIGGETIAFVLKPASYNTVILTRDTAGALQQHVLSDQTIPNQTRARLAFYNATPDCTAAGLALEPKNQPVFANVPPGSMGARTVNPVASAKVHASCGGVALPGLDLGELGAGGQYTVWVMAPSGKPMAFLARDTITPYLR